MTDRTTIDPRGGKRVRAVTERILAAVETVIDGKDEVSAPRSP